jgi:hypothetical protein
MVGRHDHVATTAEVIQVGLVRIVDEPRSLLFALGIGFVQRDDSRGLLLEFKRDAEEGVGPFISLYIIADELSGVDAIDHH